eukprot:2085040-Alexandrium_andersonii.AAC.1
MPRIGRLDPCCEEPPLQANCFAEASYEAAPWPGLGVASLAAWVPQGGPGNESRQELRGEALAFQR